MKIKIYLLLLILPLYSFGYSKTKHTKIPRTRVSIRIPNGYSIMTTGIGLIKDEKQAITIMDIIGGNYFSNQKDFNRKYFEAQGLTVYSTQKVNIDGYPGTLMVTNTNDKNLNGIMVAFGDSSFVTMISSIHEANNIELEGLLKETILSITYNNEISIDPFEDVCFSSDTSSTDFKFTLFSSNIYVFTPFGEDNPEEEAMIILTPTPFDKNITLEQVSQTSTNGLKRNGFYGFIIDSTKTYQIDDTNALLKIGDCYTGVNNMYYHQLILQKDDIVLMIYGMCENKDEEMKKEISKFCDLIRNTN